jgi:hypothetical protein
MPAKRSVGAKKKVKKKVKRKKPPVSTESKASPEVEPLKRRRKRGKPAVSTELKASPEEKPAVAAEVKAGPERNLQEVFASYQREFQAALQKSAALLNQALTQPPPADFVDKTYAQAMEMLGDIERASLHARFAPQFPRIDEASRGKVSDSAAADALAASALMMTRSTEHLNAAMESVIQRMDQGLQLPLSGVVTQEPERDRKPSPPGQKKDA